jgi:transposase-like protein
VVSVRLLLSCLSWKWRERSFVKITERTYEKERNHYTPAEKVAILRRHLLDQVPVSELCEELGLQPTVFYRWQKELFENGAAAFQAKERPAREAEEKQKRIEFLPATKLYGENELVRLLYLIPSLASWRR